MTPAAPAPEHLTPTRSASAAYAATAILAAVGFVFVGFLTAIGAYDEVPPVGHVYGAHVEGFAGVISRLADHVSYFTEWSNAVVAIAFGIAAWRPHPLTRVKRVLLGSALVMITVTAIVYQVLLAPTAHVTGWSVLTNPWQHIVVPVMVVVVYLVWGPRGWLRRDVILPILIIPVAWLIWVLTRGAIVGAYPYGFLDASTHGWPAVLTTVAMILAFGVALALGFWGLDIAIRGQQRRRLAR